MIFTTSVSTLITASGGHIIAAEYEGDGIFANSISPALALKVQPATDVVTNFVILFIAIAALASLVLLRKMPFRLLARLLRALVRPFGRAFRAFGRLIVRVLRFLSIIRKPPKPKSEIALRSVVGPTAGAIARAFAGDTETDITIAENFDTTTVRIQRNKRYLCTWLQPEPPQPIQYVRKLATDDLKKARELFSTEISIESSPQSFFEDIDSSFVVNLFKDSDKPCFYVLSEFRKTINTNVRNLSLFFSITVTLVLILNAFISNSIDFYSWFSFEKFLPVNIDLRFTSVEINLTKAVLNKIVFAGASCLIAFILMSFFYSVEYEPFQTYNGQKMENFLVQYFANINADFKEVRGNASETILGGQDAAQMKKDIVLWHTLLQWLSLRAFFIEYYLRNILYQIHRNSSYYIILIPVAFGLALLGIGFTFNIKQLNIFDSDSPLYRQSVTYLIFLIAFFSLLLYAYLRFLSKSESFVWRSIRQRGWLGFHDLKIQEVTKNILEAYVDQLWQFKTMHYGPGSGSPARPSTFDPSPRQSND